MIGKWIDGLTDEERDRIVTAEAWWFSDSKTPVGTCLVGVALEVPDPWEVWARIKDTSLAPIAQRYDKAKIRFDFDRVVRAIKLRAASAMSSDFVRSVEAETEKVS